MSFQSFGLHSDLLTAIRNLRYHAPTPIQQQAIPVALTGRDLIGCAQTGTGKTAAFALPILNKLHPAKRGKIRALILTPTRELAAQIKEVFRGLAAYTRLYTAAIYGGVGLPPQERALRLGTDVIIATPGRLLDHLNRGIGRFDSLEFLVIDEADRMLDMGFLPEVKRIIARLPQQRQTMMFSATMPTEIIRLSQQILRDPAMIQIGRQAALVEGVSQSAYPVAQHLKTDLLMTLLQMIEMELVLIFTRTKVRTERLARQLQEGGFETARIHGDRTQGQRLAALEGFRHRRHRILVATDIAARGLDVDGISHVINFDVPVFPEDYVHRIGRTARANAIGAALTLVAPAEESFLAAIQQLTKTKIPRQTVPDFNYDRVFLPRPEGPGRRKKDLEGKSHVRKSSVERSRNNGKAEKRGRART
ncbi:MAG: DEAD/DEAH box helicase [candidate division KSB1 bacterium]|nr:DEAD/DEAH box helicase [candidate division KSB1 bacterium]MDZ7302841.1 DEAD/DEAH box helicase [candidate division KSB1 bacterium]MDZ7311858.1 DEAD/DEAH box helicase [candidate division KSB1 bacterium]